MWLTVCYQEELGGKVDTKLDRMDVAIAKFIWPDREVGCQRRFLDYNKGNTGKFLHIFKDIYEKGESCICIPCFTESMDSILTYLFPKITCFRAESASNDTILVTITIGEKIECAFRKTFSLAVCQATYQILRKS